MITPIARAQERSKIHARIRRKVLGTGNRPRLCVFRSIAHIYAQVVDDLSGKTLVAASTLESEVWGEKKKAGNISAARMVGKAIAQRAKAKGIEAVVFDRGGYLYHGRVRALAEAAREGGLKF